MDAASGNLCTRQCLAATLFQWRTVCNLKAQHTMSGIPLPPMHTAQPTVYLAIKFHSDHRNRGLVEKIATELESRGMTTVCVARDFEKWGEIKLDSQDLMQVALDSIRQSDAVVIEFSEKGVGLGIEAGYASAYDIPVFVLHRSDAEVSTTLKGVSAEVIPYSDGDSLSAAIVSLIARIDPQLLELDDR